MINLVITRILMILPSVSLGSFFRLYKYTYNSNITKKNSLSAEKQAGSGIALFLTFNTLHKINLAISPGNNLIL